MSVPRFFAPEVIQTSAMDCGPASLKCVLEGFGIHVSYGRLREACQTGVDGTSIDVLEEMANQLGLQAEQTMVPLDHLPLAEAECFPAILIVRNPDGAPHFVVAWRRLGAYIQCMDPAAGRLWVRAEALLQRTYLHSMSVPAQEWRRSAGGRWFLRPLRARMRRLGALASGEGVLDQVAADPSWRPLATLDAATRMVDELVRAGAVKVGPEAARLLAASFVEAIAAPGDPEAIKRCIPGTFWSAGPLALPRDGAELVDLRGAVLVRVSRRRGAGDEAGITLPGDAAPLSPELAIALREGPTRPLHALVRALREDGALTPGLVAGAAVASTVVRAGEALVLRGLLAVATYLRVPSQRAAAVGALVILFVGSLALELFVASQSLRLGHRLETRLRATFLSKIPRLSDRYFSSRPTSDMSHRAHAIHVLRSLPPLGAHVVRLAADLLVAGAGLVWLAPTSWPYVLGVVAICTAVPLMTQRALTERDARVRAFDGALLRFHLDALLGLVPVRIHGAADAVRQEHDGMLREFARAFFGLLSVTTAADAAVGLVSAAMAIGLVAQYLARGGDVAGSLLLVYWALSLPSVCVQLASAVNRYPELRNVTERLLEPLGALEDGKPAPFAGADASSEPEAGGVPRDRRGAEIRFEGVDVVAGGATLLADVNLRIAAGSHVAIVGSSGAGKSSFCGLLLGWHSPVRGRVLIDDRPLAGDWLDAIRGETAWIDPTVRLWNRSLLDNVTYGAGDEVVDLASALGATEIADLLEQLPDGMQTSLGDGGALVSGGEGQRVRVARAMLRSRSRLVVLDEAFRGLDRDRRRRLLARARERWRVATLLCVTHDVGDTGAFDRVLVIEGGRVIEDGRPAELAARIGSRYRALLEAERAVEASVWRGRQWRHVELRAGVLVDTKGPA
jgi:ATP-binding cassette subfamily B protein